MAYSKSDGRRTGGLNEKEEDMKKKVAGIVILTAGLMGLAVLGLTYHQGTSPGVTIEASGIVTTDSKYIEDQGVKTYFEE